MAGSGRARRFRAARRLKQGPGERYCEYCHANLSLGEPHDADCEYVEHGDPYAADVDDPYAEFEQGEER